MALGHLHRPQKAGGTDHIRYSGSPTILSFSEIGYDKNVILIETDGDKPLRIENVLVPKFREVLRLKGSLEECIADLKSIDKATYALKPWVEVVIDNNMNTKIESQEINKAAEDLDLEVLKISLKNERNILGLEALIESSKEIKELQPIEVFKMKCKEQDFDIEENIEVFDAFNEALQIAREN